MVKKDAGKLWGALRKAWKAFKIAKAKGNKATMKRYAEIINELQRELGLPATKFNI